MSSSPVRSAALKYAGNRWPVVLLYGRKEGGNCTCALGNRCDNNMIAKHPIEGCGKNDATTDIETIVSWFEKYDSLKPNVGIVTGRVSGLVVLDVDPRNGGIESLAELQSVQPLPITRTVRTGSGGYHYYFKHPGPQVTVRTGSGFLGRGLDIKADRKDSVGEAGGYVVAPPSIHKSGQHYEWQDESIDLAPLPEWILELISTKEKEKEKRFTDDTQSVIEGSRHDFLMSRAGQLHNIGLTGPSILATLQSENQAKCKPPLPESEVRSIAFDVTKYESPTFRLDDIGNGKRLAHKYRNRVRHCYAQKAWYIWDGRRWKKDQVGQVKEYAKQTIESIYIDADNRQGDIAERLRDHAHNSGRIERLNAMVEAARSESNLSVGADVLDSQRLLFNCANGTLDLDTRKLKKHDPEDLLTKVSDTAFNPEATSTLWDDFIRTSVEGDEEMAAFLQRIAGYALSGLTQEEYIFFVYGPGGTGKSTFFESLKAVIGEEYCKTASFQSFLKASGAGSPNAPRSDLARLAGARLVTAIESSEGKQFAADVIKASVGGDKLVVRDLYSSEFEFHPQYKLWLASNAKPRVREDDTGMWRRLLLIPFYHVIENPDKTLKEQFRFDMSHKEAILAWAVRGFAEWRKHGLAIPKRVQRETEQYRTEMDHIQTWLEDCCEVCDSFCSFAQLWDSYLEWLKSQPATIREVKLDSKKALGLALQQKGFKSDTKAVSGKTQRIYHGLTIGL